MKYISQQSDRLSQAFERIAELENEVTRLRKELAVLRNSKPQNLLQTPPRPEKSTKSPICTHRYAQSTTASRCKDKSQTQDSEDGGDKSPQNKLPFIARDGESWTYKNGVLVQMDYSIRPSYMRSTYAVEKRELAVWREKWDKERELRKKSRSMWGPPFSPNDSRGYSEEYESDLPPTPPSSDDDMEDDPKDNLEERSRLRDTLRFESQDVTIDSKSGFRYLRRAAEIAQEAIHAVGESGAPGWKRFREGPHVVKLGRNELMSWLGEYPDQRLASNGYAAYTVYHGLLDVVYLRNAISHPCGETFSDPERVDALMKRSQHLAIVLGDEKRAFEVRQLRDDLREEAHRSVQDVLDLYYMSSLPYSTGIECAYHHEKLFQGALNLYSRYSYDYWMVLAVAQAWDNRETTDA
ncbi:hypothetical protein F5Y10DRAFT_292556 [Nemania abortiva]|nr:hypothetical protein F5Y10DRAFT_292556 [Nemania abortiva]